MKSFEINLNNLHFYSYHGVFEEEKKRGGEFIVDVSVSIPFRKEIETDQLSATVSYADIYDLVKEEMQTSRDLLEKVAYEIAKGIKNKFPQIESGKIRVEKVNPPIPGMLGSASVVLNF